MFWPSDWEFCKKSNCRDRDPEFGRRDRFFLRQNLRQLKGDVFKMPALRALLLSESSGRAVAGISDDEVLDQVANLLIGGRVHVHVLNPRVGRDLGAEATADTAPASANFPIADSNPRQRMASFSSSVGSSATGPSNAGGPAGGQAGTGGGSPTPASAPDSSAPTSSAPSSAPDSSPPSSTPPSSAPAGSSAPDSAPDS